MYIQTFTLEIAVLYNSWPMGRSGRHSEKTSPADRKYNLCRAFFLTRSMLEFRGDCGSQELGWIHTRHCSFEDRYVQCEPGVKGSFWNPLSPQPGLPTPCIHTHHWPWWGRCGVICKLYKSRRLVSHVGVEGIFSLQWGKNTSLGAASADGADVGDHNQKERKQCQEKLAWLAVFKAEMKPPNKR